MGLEEGNNLVFDFGMGLEENYSGNIWNGNKENLEDDFYLLFDEEIEEDVRM